MDPSTPIEVNNSYPASAPVATASHADVVAEKIALYIIGMVFVFIFVYFLVKFLGGDKPLSKINAVVDGYEEWREGRLEMVFDAIIDNMLEFVDTLRSPAPAPAPRMRHTNQVVAYQPQGPRRR
ncbi:hypothetical protein PENSPDRAFT_755101 [Peniophora sp. CONT]|nr:hypothetical protein PENSPDRAFT_755101 [Peniophora sp. CONT]